MAKLRQDGAVSATLAGVIDRWSGGARGLALAPEDRLDGRTALVTGANRGLGKAVALDLARRGARVILACRSGLPQAVDELARRCRRADLVGEPLDLADFDDILAFAARLRARRERLDVVVLNAGIVPSRARRTKHGFEEMFAVNYLANVLLVRTLLEHGTIPNATFADGGGGPPRPRVIFVSSESHRSAPPIDPRRVGEFEDYDMRGSVAAYGKSKLLLETFAAELGRRLTADGEVDVAVHSLCPGAVRTGIAREAPWWAKPLLGPVMWAFFRAPEAATAPVTYLAASRAIEGRTGIYLHVTEEKPPAEAALDEDLGRALYSASATLLEPWTAPPTH